MYTNLKERLDPFPENGHVYGKVIDIKPRTEGVINYYEITIDIVNDNMIEFDKNNYNIIKLHNKDNYEDPSLYFYYLIIRTLDIKTIYYFQNRYGQGYFKYKISEEDPGEISSQFGNFRIPSLLTNSIHSISGEILFYSSPAISKQYRIFLTDEEADVFEAEIPEECIIKDKVLIQIKLSELFDVSNGRVDEANIYHVGSGYYSYFQYSNGNRFFYDIGLTKFKDRETIRCPGHGYDKFKFVILSHWDADHFMGITLHEKGKQNIILSKPWICSSLINGTNATRLAFLIRYYSGNNLIMIDQNISGILYNNSHLSLIKGYCNAGTFNEMKNGNGISLFIKNFKRFVVLGDVGYKYLDSNTFPFNSTDYLVVPHHGSDKVGNINIKPRGRYSLAIIPVGKNTVKWTHPRKCVIDTLVDSGYTIHQTNIKGSLKVNLNRNSIIKRCFAYLKTVKSKFRLLLNKIRINL